MELPCDRSSDCYCFLNCSLPGRSLSVLPSMLLALLMSLACNLATASENPVAEVPTAEQLQLFLDVPEQIYGTKAVYRVYRNRKPIGFHTIYFARKPHELVINVESEMAVKLLGISLYSRRYRSEEIWSGGELVQMTTSINDSRAGTRTIEAVSRGDYLQVEDSVRDSTFTSALADHASNHWHPGAVSARRIFHVLHGRLYQGPPKSQGWERVVLDGGDVVSARRFDYFAGFNASVWYDADWRWVKLSFQADDGSTLEYKCQECRPR